MHEDYDVLDLWTGMVQARELGLAKSIGVSNFNSAQINKILTYSDVRPAVNQIEVSFFKIHGVFCWQKEHRNLVLRHFVSH